MTPTKQYIQDRDEAARACRIFEPKYGGKDHSGYEILMKYEVNDYLEECFIKASDWATARAEKKTKLLVEAIEELRGDFARVYGTTNIKELREIHSCNLPINSSAILILEALKQYETEKKEG